jgi:transposase
LGNREAPLEPEEHCLDPRMSRAHQACCVSFTDCCASSRTTASSRDVQVNLAYRWFCGLSIEDKVPDHSAFSRARNERFRHSDIFRTVFERVVEACR